MMNQRYRAIAQEPGGPAIPLQLYNIGTTQQKKIIRLDGFPVLHLFLNRSGGGRFETLQGHRAWSLGGHEACLLPAKTPHTYYPTHEEGWSLSYVTLSGNGFHALLESMGLPLMETIRLQSMEVIWPLFSRMLEEVRNNSPDLNWSVSVLLYQLLLELAKQSARAEEAPARGSGTGANPARLAASMIREHYMEPILLSEYARSLGYTAQHLNRLFKQAYGVTMHQYLDKIRFEKSVQLLHRDMSIQDIATSLGMEANYFIRAFKRIHGITPGQYRAGLLSGIHEGS